MTKVSWVVVAAVLLLALSQVAARDSLKAPEGVEPSGGIGSKAAVVADSSDDRLPADSFVALDSVPQCIQQTQPVYPKADFEAGRTGIVWIKLLINRQGLVRRSLVLKLNGATEAMGKAATDAALGWTFRPAVLKGKAIACWVSMKVQFTIKEREPEDSTATKKSPK
jgi:TonB family protein